MDTKPQVLEFVVPYQQQIDMLEAQVKLLEQRVAAVERHQRNSARAQQWRAEQAERLERGR